MQKLKESNNFYGLSSEEKKALFKKNMGIAEQTGQDHNAVGRYARPHYGRSRYHNMAGQNNPNTQYDHAKILSVTITNSGSTTENAILFGKHVATEQSGANIQITSKTAPSIEAINNEVASKPVELHSVLFQANTKAQTSQVWDLISKNLYGGGTHDTFIPQMFLDPANNSETLIDAPLPKFTASGNNWMRIPVEAGNTVTINFRTGAQLSLEGITEGTNTIE